VFDDDFEAMEFIEALRKTRDLDGWKIFAWCLMSNHYHLVVRTQSVDLWRSMARLQGVVARSYNRRHHLLGRLWQSRYRARVIDSEDYFRQVVTYVHLNPVAAGVVADPADYPYSGHREIVGLCLPYLVERSAVLQSFGFGDGRGSSDDYLHWVWSVAQIRRAKTDVAELPWWSQARNVDEIADVDCHPEATTFDGKILAENRAELGLSEFADRFESISGHTIADLASRSRSKRVVQGRVELATLAVSRYGIKCCDVAALLNKHGNSVTNWLNQGLHLAGIDPDFKQRVDQLDSSISRAT
jgi:REP element-mobilizing transposase RayT